MHATCSRAERRGDKASYIIQGTEEQQADKVGTAAGTSHGPSPLCLPVHRSRETPKRTRPVQSTPLAGRRAWRAECRPEAYRETYREAQRLLYFIAEATTRQHMQYNTADLKYETVLARNIQRVNAVASEAISLGIQLPVQYCNRYR